MKPGALAKYDYEYVREGTCNVYVAVEPKGGRRVVKVTERRTKPDFVAFVQHLLERSYASARKVHLVLDNLNTHFRSCFDEVLGAPGARRLLRRVQFHHTPKHASWLNMAEIEISILDRQCLGRRLMDRVTARREVNSWRRQRNAEGSLSIRASVSSVVATTACCSFMRWRRNGNCTRLQISRSLRSCE